MWRYIPFIGLGFSALAWLVFVLIPLIFRLQNAAAFSFFESLPWVLMGITFLIGMAVALENKHYGYYTLFLIANLVLCGWF